MTNGIGIAQAMPLRETGSDGVARRSALETLATHEAEATALVGYRSAGYLLIIGSPDAALACADRLRHCLHCTVLAPLPADDRLSDAASAALADAAHVTLVYGEPTDLRGHLGRFSARLKTPRG
ncbi:MAG: hypothetical protein R6V11_03355, partial [Ectothiorhodospiraceae bacterium]